MISEIFSIKLNFIRRSDKVGEETGWRLVIDELSIINCQKKKKQKNQKQKEEKKEKKKQIQNKTKRKNERRKKGEGKEGK